MSANQTIYQLQQNLSNTSRELELTVVINKELERMSETSLKINKTLNRLVYDIADLTVEQLDQLREDQRRAQSVLDGHQRRYAMLKGVQQKDCVLAVTRLDLESIDDKVKQYYERYGDRDRFELAAKPAINGRLERMDESAAVVEDDGGDGGRGSVSGRSCCVTRSKASPRKRVIPDRFDPTVRPSLKRTKKPETK